ncbi:MAG TPA: ComF family protein [Candidatus Caccovivens faecavium]|nr:ComF family protein [Candidatus Caccovivens faecavium]
MKTKRKNRTNNKNWLENFLRLIFPPDIKCIFCGRDINHFYERPFCDSCGKTLSFNIGNRCRICDEPIENEAIVCDNCQRRKHYFKHAYCPLVYKDKVRENILSYKIDNKRYLALGYALLIVKYIGEDIKNFDLITYVPMTRTRKKERSFNQAKLLAEEIGKIANLPVVECLKKNYDTKAQKELNYVERLDNIKNIFSVVDKDKIKNKNILLVDDIITTCATVDACAKELSRYAYSISACAVARNKLHKKTKINKC